MATWVDLLGLIVIGGGVWLALPYILNSGGGGGGGGGTVVGTNVYKATGKTCKGSPETQGIHCSGQSSTSVRVNYNGCGLLNYEATAIIQFGGGCTSACGDEATIKHYGPTHQDGNCCWALSNVQQNGDCFFGGEGPHPDTDKRQVSLGNVGNLQGKTVGIKSIIWKTSGGAHQELYIDTTSLGRNWRHIGSRNISQWGNSKTSNRIAATGGSQQVEFRVDCSKARWLATSVAEIYVPAGRYTEAYDESAAAGEPALSAVTYVPKMTELENQLSYYTLPEAPRVTQQPIVKETYLARKLNRY